MTDRDFWNAVDRVSRDAAEVAFEAQRRGLTRTHAAGLHFQRALAMDEAESRGKTNDA